jgi:hypothetical protein
MDSERKAGEPWLTEFEEWYITHHIGQLQPHSIAVAAYTEGRAKGIAAPPREPTHDQLRAMIDAYEDTTGERLPDADGEDYRIVRAMYDAAPTAAATPEPWDAIIETEEKAMPLVGERTLLQNIASHAWKSGYAQAKEEDRAPTAAATPERKWKSIPAECTHAYRCLNCGDRLAHPTPAAVEALREATIEECAKVCESFNDYDGGPGFNHGYAMCLRDSAARIRALAERDKEGAMSDTPVEAWLDKNMTYYNTAESERPVLASVSKRIWYHATDDMDSYPFSAVARAALAAPPAEGK